MVKKVFQPVYRILDNEQPDTSWVKDVLVERVKLRYSEVLATALASQCCIYAPVFCSYLSFIFCYHCSDLFQFLCDRCTFRCDTQAAYSRHSEYHSSKSIFKCRLCDYSANTKKIVTFHESFHHLDKPLSFHYRDKLITGEEKVVCLKSIW